MKARLRLTHWCWLAAALTAICLSSQAARNNGGPLVGRKAPDFHMQGIYGEDYSLETYKGHILVMQFGTSW
jgi:hypothetical protein